MPIRSSACWVETSRRTFPQRRQPDRYRHRLEGRLRDLRCLRDPRCLRGLRCLRHRHRWLRRRRCRMPTCCRQLRPRRLSKQVCFYAFGFPHSAYGIGGVVTRLRVQRIFQLKKKLSVAQVERATSRACETSDSCSSRLTGCTGLALTQSATPVLTCATRAQGVGRTQIGTRSTPLRCRPGCRLFTYMRSAISCTVRKPEVHKSHARVVQLGLCVAQPERPTCTCAMRPQMVGKIGNGAEMCGI